MLLLLLDPASAMDLGTFEDPDEVGLLVAFRAVGESLSDPSISSVYRPSIFTGGVGIVIPFHSLLQADIEVSYTRLSGQELLASDKTTSDVAETLELIPLSAVLEARYSLASGELFAGLGPALTPFKSLHSPDETNGDITATTGSKIALELRAGIRLDTGMIQPPISPVGGRPAQALDFELYVGRRHQLHPANSGYDLGAWRASAGLAVRF